jgi:hypothetical protein
MSGTERERAKQKQKKKKNTPNNTSLSLLTLLQEQETVLAYLVCQLIDSSPHTQSSKRELKFLLKSNLVIDPPIVFDFVPVKVTYFLVNCRLSATFGHFNRQVGHFNRYSQRNEEQREKKSGGVLDFLSTCRIYMRVIDQVGLQ